MLNHFKQVNDKPDLGRVTLLEIASRICVVRLADSSYCLLKVETVYPLQLGDWIRGDFSKIGERNMIVVDSVTPIRVFVKATRVLVAEKIKARFRLASEASDLVNFCQLDD